MGGKGKHKWFSFHHRSASASASASEPPHHNQKAPPEFLCPISGFLMSDPVVVTSGQTFERMSVQVCRNLGFVAELEDGTRPNFSTVIPNLAMKSTILSWCDRSGLEHPRPPDYAFVEGVVRARIEAGSGMRISVPGRLPSVTENLPVPDKDDNEVQSRFRNFDSSSSVESVTVNPVTPPSNPTQPVSFSSSSSSSWSGVIPEAGTLIQNPSSFSSEFSSSPPISPEEEEIFIKLRSPDIFDCEQGLILLRKMTRSSQEARVSLCTDRILSFLRSLIVSRYSLVQTNAAASVVNLSLEKQNKVKIVRSGFVPLLIDVLKSGSSEAQEHAAGALFSLALEDENKMVIGVLGALQPLLHAVRAAERDRARQDAAVALYHLSLIPSNSSKLVQLGAVPALLSMIRSSKSAAASRVLLVLCNLAACPEGKAAMLEGNAVSILVGKLRDGGCDSEAVRENCVAALLALSQGNMRFKGLAKEAGAEELLKEVEEIGSKRAKEKAVKVLQILRGEEGLEGGEARGLQRMLEASGLSRTQFQAGQNGGFAISSQF